jgi:hypothetical protein
MLELLKLDGALLAVERVQRDVTDTSPSLHNRFPSTP